MKKAINLRKFFFLIIYRVILIHLPVSNRRLIGNLSKKLRYLACKQIFSECGINVNIEKGAKFGNGFNIIIGDNSGIGLNCIIPNDTNIGKNVMMGPNVYILGNFTHVTDEISVPMIFQGLRPKGPVVIEDNVWIGRQVIINYERTIREGSIIAAGSVVTKDFNSYSLIGGNPAQLIKSRYNS
jgi:maltose O-acetyltransferase